MNDSMPVDEAFGVIARVARGVSVPVTADLEAGYGLSPEDLVGRLLDAGAVGCNLEDTDHHGGAGRCPRSQRRPPRSRDARIDDHAAEDGWSAVRDHRSQPAAG
jgi:2-methylisocitrate lyase-like PEP mutase family enzyme